MLAVLHPQLEALGFQVEKAAIREQKIERPVFSGENGVPAIRYQIDALRHYRPREATASRPLCASWASAADTRCRCESSRFDMVSTRPP